MDAWDRRAQISRSSGESAWDLPTIRRKNDNTHELKTGKDTEERMTAPTKKSSADSVSPNTDAVLRALADPHRRRMLRLVRNHEVAAGEIATHFEMTQQAVSQHLRVLKQAGLLSERREGTRRLYALRPESLEPVRAVLEEFWPAALDRLKQIVEANKENDQRG
jgi:DNA-binding transcriptional ArsR family regulator